MSRTWGQFLPELVRSRLAGLQQAASSAVVSNAGWQLADNLLRMAVALVVGIWLARYLGPAQFGLFSYAVAFVALFSSISSLGLDDIIVRDIVRTSADKETILGTSFTLKLVGGVVAFFAALGTIFFLRPNDGLSQGLVAIIGIGTVFQAFNVIEFWFHSQVQAKYAVLAKNAAFLLCSLGKVVLILVGAPLVAFAWIASAEVMLGMSGLILAYHVRGNRILHWNVQLKKGTALLKDSWPLMLSSVVIVIYLRIDQIMLGDMAGDAEVGIYSVAVRLAEVWYFIPSAIYWSLFPGIVEARGLGDEMFFGHLQRLYNWAALSAYAVALPVTFVAPWLVSTLFGEAYARAGLMLSVLIWSNVFTSLEMARSGFLTAMNWTRLYLLTVTLGCLLNVGLNWMLIPRYGGMGAVVASLAAYWFAAHGSCFIFKPLWRTGVMLTRALAYPKVW